MIFINIALTFVQILRQFYVHFWFFMTYVGVHVHAYLCFGHMCMYTHACGGLGLSWVVFLEPSAAYALKQYLLPRLMFPVLTSLTCSGNFRFYLFTSSASGLLVMATLILIYEGFRDPKSVLICKPHTLLTESPHQVNFCFWSESSSAFPLPTNFYKSNI